MVTIPVPEFEENGRGAVNLSKILLANLTAIQFQVSAGLNLAGMRDEYKTLAAKASPRDGVQAEILKVNGLTLFLGPLAQDAEVVGSTGGFEFDGNLGVPVIEPV